MLRKFAAKRSSKCFFDLDARKYLFLIITHSVLDLEKGNCFSHVKLKGYEMLYEKFEKAWEDTDVDLYKSLHHADWEFKFHSSGHIMKFGDVSDEQLASMLQNNINENSRCVYENDDILVQHSIVTFPSGDKEAVLMVSQKKDGLIWRTETGATPLK